MLPRFNQALLWLVAVACAGLAPTVAHADFRQAVAHGLPLTTTATQADVSVAERLATVCRLDDPIEARVGEHGITPERLAELRYCGLELSSGSNEALAIREPRAAEWLQLRFGWQLQPISLSNAWLMDEVLELPAPAPLAYVG